jgi:hypothetical protein
MVRKTKVYPEPADQSARARKARLYSDGSCPIHDTGMGQIDGWYYDDEWGKYTIVGCATNGCKVAAKAFSAHGPWELLEEHAHLLEEGPAAL